MNFVVLVLTLIAAGAVLFQDFRDREVMLFLFPLLALCGLALSLSTEPLRAVLRNAAVNLLLLLVQLVLLYSYFRLLKGNRRFLNQKIGWGDVLFLAACCFFFAPPAFLIFYTVSLLFALLLHYLFLRYQPYRTKGTSIALAGWQACLLLLLLIVHTCLRVPLYWCFGTANLLLYEAGN